jgi:acyl-coenzyme A synthetase/AMP-(fatty) acid ligase
LNAKALVVEAGSTSPARLAAAKQGLAVLEIEIAAGAAAGDFRFAAEAPADASPAPNGGPAGPDDCALVLHTSGTTSRPKIVPLSQTNGTASAQYFSSSLSLITDDI